MKTMSPSETISRGQINKLYDLLEAGILKADLPREPGQKVIEDQGASMVDSFIADFRKRIEAISKFIVRRISVNCNRTSQQAIDATGRKQYTNASVVATMPRAISDKAEVHFFKPRPESYDENGFISDDKLEEEFKFVGLVPVDPVSLAAVNEEDPAFADNYPHGTHWKDADGKWYFAAFSRWIDERSVYVYRDDSGWDGSWWFAGVRKP
jgi:hypothetical protein